MLKCKDINVNFLLKYKEIIADFLLKYKDFSILVVAAPQSDFCMRQIDYSNSGLCSKVCFVSYFFFTVVLMIIFFGMFHIGNETAFRR